MPKADAITDWRATASELPSRAPAGSGRSRRRYFDSAKEVWARSYAQTVLTRSHDPWLQGHLLGLLDLDDAFVWPATAFAPLADEVERVLGRLGLLRAELATAAVAAA